MPYRRTTARARRDARQGKSPSTQAGEFVRDEIRKIRRGQHGARNTKQAIAIGLSEARRAGVKLPAPRKGRTSGKVRRQAHRDLAKARSHQPPSSKRSRATIRALKREPRSTVSRTAMSHQARQSARNRTARERSAAARKAARTRQRTKRTH